MSGPKVTIAIPTLNRAEYLRLALASALAQTYDEVEVLVSDNASQDHTAEVLASFSENPRLRVIRQERTLSMVENWNVCVSAATGEYFLLLSDDDLLEPEAIAQLVRGYEAGPLPAEKIGMVYCRCREIDKNGNSSQLRDPSPTTEGAKDLILNFFQMRRATYACSILFRHSDIVDGYNAALPLATDAAQWMQAVVKHGDAVFLDCILASYRMHENTTATTPIATWQEEHRRLAEFAIELLFSAGLGDERRNGEIHHAVNRLNISLVPFLLNQCHAGRNLKLLKSYCVHWRSFASLFGLCRLIIGLMEHFTPRFMAFVIRTRRRLRKHYN
jgi:glycosyltransferase involved in cell wall biosynthesis